MPIAEITHLVADVDESVDFYTGALGFVVRADATDGRGNRRVVVGPADGGVGLVLTPAEEGEPLGAPAGARVAYILATGDFAAAHTRMVAEGVHFREEPRHEVYGTVAVFEDHQGMAWDLIEYPRP